MSRPLDPDSQSERIFSDDDGNEEDSFSLNPLSAQQAHRASSPSPNAMKRRRILPAIFDSSGEEENDEEHSQARRFNGILTSTITLYVKHFG